MKALESNSEQAVQTLSRLAFAQPDVEIQMRLLTGLAGVRVPTASCILAWTNPKSYGVIDRRACLALNYIVGLQIDPQSISGWVVYLSIVRDVAQKLDITPMAVDRRLYGKGGAK